MKAEEHEVRPPAHVLADDLGDRLGPVADRGDQRREVVDAADEDRADENPDQRRQPAEHEPGENRPDDRPGGGDRRKVLRQQAARREAARSRCRRAARRRACGVGIEPQQPREDAAVDPIGDQQHDGRGQDDGEEVH